MIIKTPFCNTYGSLAIKAENGKYYAMMEDCYDDEDWIEITYELYTELFKISTK